MLIHPADNVEVREDGHKYAIKPIGKSENVIKYGNPIGHATADIRVGEHVHSHNLSTNLSGKLEYTYKPFEACVEEIPSPMIMGYEREDGQVGIRNDVWIVNTVACVNKIAEQIALRTGAKCFPHPYGCSQLGEDAKVTMLILKGLVNHPNAGAVLVLGLGCENNNISVFKEVLGSWDEKRILFLNTQDVEDEIEEGIRLVKGLQERAAACKRIPVPFSKLKIGLKCGGSDAFSGITANPLCGRFCDRFTAMGGSCVLTEVPEMFGAEHLLMGRSANEAVFDKMVSMINDFKDYYAAHNQVIYENPSPGNKAGGITTLEEKSLGCVQKGGLAPIVDVLKYGDVVTKPGLSVLDGPGNDPVAVTNLMAAGCQMMLFTTGRGTPLGTGVPTVKIATNSALAKKKSGWIDFDAQSGDLMQLEALLIEIANGKSTRNEENGCEEIAIFKDGVTL